MKTAGVTVCVGVALALAGYVIALAALLVVVAFVVLVRRLQK